MTRFDYNHIRAELTRLNKTQEELARDVGVAASTMNRWLRGKHNPLMIYQKRIVEIVDGWSEEESSRVQIGEGSIPHRGNSAGG